MPSGISLLLDDDFSIPVCCRHPSWLPDSTPRPIWVSSHQCALLRNIKNVRVVTVARPKYRTESGRVRAIVRGRLILSLQAERIVIE